MFCTQCGKEMEEGQQFCTSCGTRVADGGGDSPNGAQASPRQESGNRPDTGECLSAPPAMASNKSEVAVVWVSKILSLLYWLVRRVRVLIFVFAIIFFVYLMSTGGCGMEGDVRRTFKSGIQEHLIDDNGWGKYISLDTIEEFEVSKNSSDSEKWTGTATVRFKGKRGSSKGETVSVEYRIEAKRIYRSRGDQVMVEWEPVSDREVSALAELVVGSGADFED